MKFLFIIISTALLLAACSNQKVQTSPSCYKGRLEIKGICSNYTIKVLDGGIDTTKFVANWTDENTGKHYTNVFGLASACKFPSSINAGDEFYFVLDTARQNCPVCMAYYPTPSKKLYIKVLDRKCD